MDILSQCRFCDLWYKCGNVRFYKSLQIMKESVALAEISGSETG